MEQPGPLPTQAEIAVLEALADQREVLSAGGGGAMAGFRGALRFVDPQRRYVVVGRSGDRVADEALLAQAGVEFFVEWGEWRIVFAAQAPEAVTHEGAEAIRLLFPQSVSIGRRRMFERAPVSGSALRCVAYSGAVAVFEASVTDISQGGVGLRIDTAGDALEPGMVLQGCRLEGLQGDPATVDLEVRHTEATWLADGQRTVRAGCRFVNLSPSAMALVSRYAGAKPPG
jgi:c-di-GMP-binding flagellar brake protein YcgR